jgi:penicillin amidase
MQRFLRRLRRWTLRLLLLLLVLAAAAGALLWNTLPGGDLNAAIPGLSGPVQVTIDGDGVPRIEADNALDAAAALGFVHARERLFQMELTRRAAAGELAEIAGALALPNDRLMRTLGVRQSAEADLAGLPADTRAMLEAYARGVNAWTGLRGRFAGLEFLFLGAPRPWAPVDSLLWGKAMGLFLSGNWRTELARASLARRLPWSAIDRLWPERGGAGHPEAALAATAAKLAAVVPRFPAPFTQPETASNEWAVDGAHSGTGAPLLAGDPHLGFSMPAIWYLARIDTPEGTLAGATAPGVPFLVLGRNSHIAWSFTTTGADTQDLFVETSAGGDFYATPDGPRRFEHRSETIHVRGGADEVLDVRISRHGPVVSDLVAPDGPILAVSMANLAPGDTAAAGLHALNRATSVAAAGVAAAAISSPIQNMVVADRDGIGLFVTGRVPRRLSGDGSRPAPGADGSHDWVGWASGEALPHVVNPASGRLVNANERVAPADFPVFLGKDWFGDERAQRIRERLDARKLHDVAEFAGMQTDIVSVVAREVLPRLRAVTPTIPADRAAWTLLADWDGTMRMDAPQPLIFNAWLEQFDIALRARLDAPEVLAPARELSIAALSPGGEAYCGESCEPLLEQSLARTVAALSARFGPDPASWRWGAVHEAVFAHPILGRISLLETLAAGRIAVPGDGDTLFRGAMRGGSFDSIHGAAYRGVYDLADLDRSVFVVSPGQSGNILSPLAWNFMQRWAEGGTVLLPRQPPSVGATLRLVGEPPPP